MLFENGQLTGFIDFGAMRMESVAGDLARLLGSLEGHIDSVWQVGLDAYQQRRRLDAREQAAIQVFDAANVVLSGLNWVRWLALEKRRFDDRDGVQARLDEILLRLG